MCETKKPWLKLILDLREFMVQDPGPEYQVMGHGESRVTFTAHYKLANVI